MANIRVRIWLMSVIFGLALVTGCGKDSGTDSDSDSSTSTVESSSVTCSQDKLCKGTYTSNVESGKGLLNGPCNISYVDGGQSFKIVFQKSDACDFKWVQATGDTATYWANLVNVNNKLTVQH